MPGLAGLSGLSGLSGEMGIAEVTLILQPGAAAGYDTYVNEFSPDTSFAANAVLGQRSTATRRQNSLIRFDLSGIPPGATILSAILSLWTSIIAPGNYTLSVYAILVANTGWLETCTWNFADGAVGADRWAGDAGGDGGVDAGCSISGTDYNAAVIGTSPFVAGELAGTRHDIILNVAQMNAMLANNYGMMMTCNFSGNCGVRSSDDLTVGQQPMLTIVYRP